MNLHLPSFILITGLVLTGTGAAIGAPPGYLGGQNPMGSTAVPFGGAYAPGQTGRRPEQLQRPSGMPCTQKPVRSNRQAYPRQDASGRLHMPGQNGLLNPGGNIYGNCGNTPPPGIRAKAGSGPSGSAYNNRTNTLKAASDGYVNRSATSSMMPRKPPSMYDATTGTLKPSRKLDAYQIYQR
ncbi:hypothetical protein [Zoogloea sp.]|uniref:hypothetical protein n=1 Tax=Zoogloea sp. TaxID=49181 RepID=UPI00260DC7EA|nr:hypothetical protein [Zoogloea sp.]MDD3354881.1 hypothetical protein [Zoogloea sp.]